MKKYCAWLVCICLVFSSLTSMSAPVYAELSNISEFVNEPREAGVYALINYPQCPNDSSHTRRKFLNRGSSGHLAYCATCGATLIALTDHIWSVETPTCEIGKYCILCNYSVPGQEKLGHDVYPVASDEYYAVNSDVHGHVCMRTECDYNPEHDFYYETIGYLEDEPYGIHIYYNVRIESYMGTNGKWMHHILRDCGYCDYTESCSYFQCAYNNSQCNGGCTP